jgi:hypothetical protein
MTQSTDKELTVEEIAEKIASMINYGALDDRQERLRTLLIQFAEEIQRRAIEP